MSLVLVTAKSYTY